MTRPLTFAWFLMALLVIAGFIHVQTLADRVDAEARARAEQVDAEARARAHGLCHSVRESKEAVLVMTEGLREYARNQAELHEGGEDPETEEARDAFVEDIRESIGYQECPPDPKQPPPREE